VSYLVSLEVDYIVMRCTWTIRWLRIVPLSFLVTVVSALYRLYRGYSGTEAAANRCAAAFIHSQDPQQTSAGCRRE
jgi:hypothetical protein